jgi:PKD repeat protein
VVAKIGGHGYGITPIKGISETNLAGGYQAQHAERLSAGPLTRRYDAGPSGGTQLLNIENGPVMHSATTHVIYWDPKEEFTSTTASIVDGFFSHVAQDSGLSTNVFGVAGQYTDSTGHAAYSSASTVSRIDREEYPPSECTAPSGEFADPGPPYTECLLDEQLQGELARFITAEKLPAGPTQLYFILLPHRVVTCLEEEVEPEPGVFEQACSNNTFCAYHSYIEPGTANEIIYADIPFSLLDTTFAKGCQADGNSAIQLPNGDEGTSDTETRFADVAVKYISHEYIEAVTDPLVGFDTAWADAQGLEIGDKCNGVPYTFEEEGEPGFDKHAFTPTLGGTSGTIGPTGTLFNQAIFGTGFYLQSEWDNGARACLLRPVTLSGEFTSGTATAGAPVSFSATSSDPYGGFEPSWSFGDGGTATGPSPVHTFATAGAYTVTMIPKDALTNSTGPSTTATVTVAAAPAPVVVPAPAVINAQPAPPNSAFSIARASINAKTGALTLTTSVADPGTFNWLATFQNGKFGAFGPVSKCKRGLIKLRGKCRPARIAFAKGSKLVAAPAAVNIVLKPSASARKALRSALRQKKGLPVSIVLTFQSARGGRPVSRTFTLTIKPKK